MARQTKNVITLDSLKKELRHTNVADMKYGAVLLTVFAPFTPPKITQNPVNLGCHSNRDNLGGG